LLGEGDIPISPTHISHLSSHSVLRQIDDLSDRWISSCSLSLSSLPYSKDDIGDMGEIKR